MKNTLPKQNKNYAKLMVWPYLTQFDKNYMTLHLCKKVKNKYCRQTSGKIDVMLPQLNE